MPALEEPHVHEGAMGLLMPCTTHSAATQPSHCHQQRCWHLKAVAPEGGDLMMVMARQGWKLGSLVLFTSCFQA